MAKKQLPTYNEILEGIMVSYNQIDERFPEKVTKKMSPHGDRFMIIFDAPMVANENEVVANDNV